MPTPDTAAAASVFVPKRRALDTKRPELGTVAVLPWDEEIFGFPVGELERGDLDAVTRDLEGFVAKLEAWAREGRVELVSVRVGADEVRWLGPLARAGFVLADNRWKVTLARLQAAELPETQLTLRAAVPADRSAVEEIAASAFRYGRYHTDPRFPEELANKRYRLWMQNALERPARGDTVHVLGPPGEVNGFFHVNTAEGGADLRLGAVRSALQGVAGFHLYVATLRALRAAGATRAVAVIPAANTAVVNVYAALGFRFSDPELVFHWHARDAAHLNP